MKVADFDGDGTMDLLTLSGAGGPCYTLTIHWVGVADGRIRVGKCVLGEMGGIINS